MTSNDANEATVYLHLDGDGYVPVGILEYLPSQARSVFTYGRRYVERPNAVPIDPVRLPLTFTGRAMTPRRATMFNALRDAAPDRWGRKVLGLLAGRPAETLSEFDILTAHHSRHRIGALAFGPNPTSGPRSMAPWAGGEDFFVRDLGQLQKLAGIIGSIADATEEDLDAIRASLPDDAFAQALTSLYSVGGARPKAMIEFEGKFWIAKFPKGDDAWNEPLVEHATMTLAAKCGIDVAATRVIELGGITVLLVQRFDRNVEVPRHFVSGFTVQDVQEDGDWGSYQDLALAARRLGDDTAPQELFRRMAFNALCANTDDHPRNHAFFVERRQVRLTPAFDLVPRQIRSARYDLALRCGEYGTEASVRNLLSRTEPFGLSPQNSRRILGEIQDVFAGWREHFGQLGVTERDLRELALRFSSSGHSA